MDFHGFPMLFHAFPTIFEPPRGHRGPFFRPQDPTAASCATTAAAAAATRRCGVGRRRTGDEAVMGMGTKYIFWICLGYV